MKPALSMRLKLTAWYVLLFTLFLTVLCVIAYQFRARHLEYQFDAALLQRAQEVAGTIVKLDQPWAPGPAEAALSNLSVMHLSLWDDDRALLFSTDGPDTKLPLHIMNDQADRSYFWTLYEKQAATLYDTASPLRVVTMAFHDDERNRYYVQIAVEAGYLAIIAGGGQAIFAIMLPLSVLAAGVLTWFLVGRALRPMDELSDAARQVQPNHLEPIDIHPEGTEASKLQEALNEALERIAKGYRAREQFISFIAHELKTPVSVVLTESQVVRTSNPSADDYEQYLNSVEEEMRRVGKLIESFLTLTRAEHGQELVRKRIVSINDVVLDTVSECHVDARHNEITLTPHLVMPDECDSDPDIYGDEALLCTMIGNLIHNAIRHSTPGSVIDATVECLDGHAEVSVRDRGPGIPREIIDTIFDQFAQFSDERGRTGQLGLGLAIVRHIAALHDGTVAVRNCEDGGCVFTVTLPLHREERVINPARDGRNAAGLSNA